MYTTKVYFIHKTCTPCKQVPSEVFRLGRTRVFFRAGQISTLQKILNETGPEKGPWIFGRLQEALANRHKAKAAAEEAQVRCTFCFTYRKSRKNKRAIYLDLRIFANSCVFLWRVVALNGCRAMLSGFFSNGLRAMPPPYTRLTSGSLCVHGRRTMWHVSCL